jgi:UDP-N-acetylglucosamine 4-epimerase
MRVLVTGGAGFIGSNIVNTLNQNESVELIIVIDSLINGDIKNLKKSNKIFFKKGDICDYELIEDLCERVDVICHQAAWGSVPKSIEYPKDYMLNNVYGFSNIIEAAKKTGVKKIIYASSSSVYGDNESEYKLEDNIGKQLSPYGLSKRFDEMLARSSHELYNINFYGLRYFNVFGENQKWDSEYSAVIPKFIKSVLEGKQPTIYGDGEQSRDFTYIKNVVDMNINLIMNEIEEGSHILNIGMGKSTSVNNLFNLIKQKMSSDIEPTYSNKRKGDILNSKANIEKSLRFGYSPEVNLERGLEKTIDWFLKNKHLLV